MGAILAGSEGRRTEEFVGALLLALWGFKDPLGLPANVPVGFGNSVRFRGCLLAGPV